MVARPKAGISSIYRPSSIVILGILVGNVTSIGLRDIVAIAGRRPRSPRSASWSAPSVASLVLLHETRCDAMRDKLLLYLLGLRIVCSSQSLPNTGCPSRLCRTSCPENLCHRRSHQSNSDVLIQPNSMYCPVHETTHRFNSTT